MFQHFKTYMKAEEGAVTVDWVVLTAAVCALAVIAIATISGGTGSVGTNVENWLSAREAGE